MHKTYSDYSKRKPQKINDSHIKNYYELSTNQNPVKRQKSDHYKRKPHLQPTTSY